MTQSQIPRSSPSSVTFDELHVGGGGDLLFGLDSVIGLLSDVAHNEGRFTTEFTFSGGGSHLILDSPGTSTASAEPAQEAAQPVVGSDWRANVRKLARLARLQHGWDYPSSQPMDSAAEAHFLQWVSTVPDERMNDAEPMLTDEGHIRLEWRNDGYVRIAEIGPDSLYLALLTPNHTSDDAEEFEPYHQEILDRFFLEGTFR